MSPISIFSEWILRLPRAKESDTVACAIGLCLGLAIGLAIGLAAKRASELIGFIVAL